MNHDDILILLETAVQKNFQRYRDFLENDPGDNPKNVTAHHNAGKAAVTHMTALKKLTQLFEKTKTTTDDDLEALLRQARHVLTQDTHDTEHQL